MLRTTVAVILGQAEYETDMMTSSNGYIFRGTRASDAELWRLIKQLWGWWFETLSLPLWRHCNEKLVMIVKKVGSDSLAVSTVQFINFQQASPKNVLVYSVLNKFNRIFKCANVMEIATTSRKHLWLINYISIQPHKQSMSVIRLSMNYPFYLVITLKWNWLQKYLMLKSSRYAIKCLAMDIMTPSNGKLFHVTVPLCGESTSHWWTPLTKGQ